MENSTYLNDLDRYLYNNEISSAVFGAFMSPPIMRQTVHNWRTNKFKPNYSNRIEIERITIGVVKANSFDLVKPLSNKYDTKSK